MVFVVRSNLKTLSHLKQRRLYRAEDGARGGSNQRHGRDGSDVEIPVPPGTLIRDAETGDVLEDLKEEGRRWVFLPGGRGGKGNRTFATSTRRAPKFSKPGTPGQERRLVAELNLIADAGLVGPPNAGKSTLLSRLTRARPAIAGYPFTTKIPHLGMLRLYDRDIVIADIPGIIEGAWEGAGMGLSFLRHISRTRILVLVVDLSDDGFLEMPRKLVREIEAYGHGLAGKRRILLGNKLDVPGTESRLAELVACYPAETVLGLSAMTGEGIDEVVESLTSILPAEVEG